jgi:hypothetical protein
MSSEQQKNSTGTENVLGKIIREKKNNINTLRA